MEFNLLFLLHLDWISSNIGDMEFGLILEAIEDYQELWNVQSLHLDWISSNIGDMEFENKNGELLKRNFIICLLFIKLLFIIGMYSREIYSGSTVDFVN